MSQTPSLKSQQFRVAGMDCGSCAKTIEVGLLSLKGVDSALVSFTTGIIKLSYDPMYVNETAIYDRIVALGYTVERISEVPKSPTDGCKYNQNHQHEHHCVDIPKTDTAHWKFWTTNRRGQSVILAGVGLILGLVAQKMALSVWIARFFYGIGIIIAGYPIARAGLFELRLRRADMNLLMTVSVIGAVILNDWFEAGLVVFLFSLGSTLQLFSFGRTRNAIRALMNLTPSIATVKRNDEEVSVSIGTVEVGETLVIRPGGRIALDGIVIKGASAVDQSAITGESIPEDKLPGDVVYAGTINQTGFLEVKVTHTANDTTVAKIINLVEEAQESKATSQQWVDKFASIYTPIVILIALAISLIPPFAFSQAFDVWVYRALVMLVIACPCALVISTPVSIVSAIGAATRLGVLFKGGYALETAGKLHTVAFDKTGTITQGLPTIQNVYSISASIEKILEIAASLEIQSEHPFAKAIVAEAYKQRIKTITPENFQSFPGKGVWGSLNEQTYAVGNRRLFKEIGIPILSEVASILAEVELKGQTPILVGNEKQLLGVIAVSDGLRLEAAETVRLLKQAGVKKQVMLTGDRDVVASSIARQIGITEYRAELLPQDKLAEIQKLQRNGVVGMVGDGINDAPALAAADISFAVGGIDIALETADIVLVGSDLRKLAYAVNLSRRTVSVIQQNVVFSLITKGLFLLLGTFGIVGLAVAVLADTGSSLLVTANGMRLFQVKDNFHYTSPRVEKRL
ncbi:MAG: cadmium-translocating P-type ATPase [Calothrix sp. C42_A2020_038]|nr:cadmium-translocating P-type ATPase [Calothrix sp. C42_A2020_038]